MKEECRYCNNDFPQMMAPEVYLRILEQHKAHLESDKKFPKPDPLWLEGYNQGLQDAVSEREKTSESEQGKPDSCVSYSYLKHLEQEAEGWEERFDKKFKNEYSYYDFWCCSNEGCTGHEGEVEDLKDFIAIELQRAREEGRKEGVRNIANELWEKVRLSQPTASENALTASMLRIQSEESEHYIRIKHALRTVLDFVERWNKQDAEQDVAEAAQVLNALAANKVSEEAKSNAERKEQ